ncbi:MAG: hypothetical protein A2474_03940 [Elusimicrobia bacterium RIFOXYC2_FULL_34_12]|nr:MAG: hypothetical protein A2474_03940 [Elusimicrobia bacterium RIFOXYC2_FULL_34_12]OGS38455.1 MAG: hypothetical protein A2551_06565 [Elusimicrobia bacterium RIFOXYD2_FULL_34_30]HAM38261.1 glycosyl transferase [Elusimicrobiota bacterium]
MKLSVIIPVYNEVSTISELIKRVNLSEISIDKEIIIVDGNSTDGTIAVLKELEKTINLKIIYEENTKGKGLAVRKGFDAATGELIIIQDADLELNPNEYANLIKPIIDGKTSVVFGSRFMHPESEFMFKTYFANKITVLCMQLLFRNSVNDALTCYKVFDKRLLNRFNFRSDGFDLDVEITVKLLKEKIKIYESPVKYLPRSYKEGKKIHWKHGFKMLFAVFKYWLIQ